MNQHHFKYFLSDTDQNLLSEYQIGLGMALRKFSVDGVILSTAEQNPKEETCIICAFSGFKKPVAGIRLEIKSEQNYLPLEKCRVYQKPQIMNFLNSLVQQNLSIAELSGLWVDPHQKGFGLGSRLVKEATELAIGFGIETIVAMPPLHTINYFFKIGYVQEKSIPQMAYPDDRYVSTVVYFTNPSKKKYITESLVEKTLAL